MADPKKVAAGRARAAALPAGRRQDIARRAAAKRHGIPAAIYGSADSPLRIGDVELQCYVLDDGTRVITQAAFLQALGRHPKASVKKSVDGEEQVPPILQGAALRPFISQEILRKTSPVQFLPPTGGRASGYRAEALPTVCEIYLKARDAGVLLPHQKHVAQQAEVLIRSLAGVAIIALVDEATGYQYVRARNALSQILEEFIAKELQPWVKTFPDDFYKHLFRLRGMDYPRDIVKRPPYFGHLTNDIVYKRLAPGVLDELKRTTPKRPSGRRSQSYQRKLTPEIGHPKLREHLASVITVMKLSDDYEDFSHKLDRVHPKYGNTIEMDLDEAAGDPTGL